MRDFTLPSWKRLLNELLRDNYQFVTFADYVERKEDNKIIILRHDVDKKPLHSLQVAEIENEIGIKGTYYFRVNKNRLPRETIERIAKMGHEIGYHYDDLNIADGVVNIALDSFRKNLAKLRDVAPIKTACMHGSPLSRFDNRDMWKHADYREFGIVGEPYFDIDFAKVLYLTDTGRRWDGGKVSIRDKVRGDGAEVSSQKSVVSSKKNEAIVGKKIHSTIDIIYALKNDLLPDQIMLTVHPQRWTNEWVPWVGELVGQKIKNVVKYIVVRRVDSR